MAMLQHFHCTLRDRFHGVNGSTKLLAARELDLGSLPHAVAFIRQCGTQTSFH